MKRVLNVAIAGVILLALLGYMVTYTVRFNETAIVTTFGRAGEESVVNAPGPDGEPGEEAGLHFKLPWPIQQVAREYDTRVQTLDATLEQTSTADLQSVIVNAYVTWRVSDPLAFYTRVGSIREAEQAITQRVRSSYSVIGNYAFDELVNTNPQDLRLEDAEQAMEQAIQARLDELDYGIKIEGVGIKKIGLPPAVTDSVFARMRAEREAIAQAARSEGEVLRGNAESTARSDAELIESFAGARASEIEAQGRSRAAQIISTFAQDEELATFLIQLEALRETLGERTRFILDTTNPPFSLLRGILPRDQQPAPQDSESQRQQPQQARGSNDATTRSAVID